MSPKEIESELVQLLEDEQKREEAIRTCAAFVLKNKGHWEDAKEIFSQAVFSLLSKTSDASLTLKQGNVAAYLNGICRNLWITKLRNEKRPLAAPELAKDRAAIIDHLGLPSEKEILEEKFVQLERCFNQLGERCKKVLTAAYWDKMAYRKIADSIGTSEENARKIAARCREKLKECFMKSAQNHE